MKNIQLSNTLSDPLVAVPPIHGQPSVALEHETFTQPLWASTWYCSIAGVGYVHG